MAQSQDGHLFCLECAKRAAQAVIGLRKVDIKCLSTDKCEFKFPETEIERFLPPK
jgi:E3 ubiquitin-protein ligase RNF216